MSDRTVPQLKVLVFRYLDHLAGALVENEKLVDFRLIDEAKRPLPGQIRLGQIREVNRSLSGAFVEIGDEKPAFLPLEKDALSSYKNGQELVVEVKKAAVGSKGCAVTDCFSLRGDLVVLSHGKLPTGVSKKITDPSERKRLKTAAEGFEKRETAGYVIRTESEGIEAFKLQTEASHLVRVYDQILKKAKYAKTGTVLHQNGSVWLSFMQSVPLHRTEEILLAGDLAIDEMKGELEVHDPGRLEKVRVYESGDAKASQHLQEIYRLPSQLAEALEKKVWIDGGGYLFVEQTEALCAIDVNTGKLSGSRDEKQTAIEAANIAAIPEIVRQIRLRDLSGIILIDFVDMEKEEARGKVLAALQSALDADLRKTTVYGFTKLQLCEMARERKDKPLKDRLGSTQ